MLSGSLYRMPDYSLQPLRRYFPRITQINLVVHSLLRYIQCVSLFFHKPVHCIYRSQLIVLRSDMYTLYTQTFLIGKIFNLRKILFFLCRSFPDSPIEVFPSNKIRQSNDWDPLKIFLTGINNPGYSILPPELLLELLYCNNRKRLTHITPHLLTISTMNIQKIFSPFNKKLLRFTNLGYGYTIYLHYNCTYEIMMLHNTSFIYFKKLTCQFSRFTQT